MKVQAMQRVRLMQDLPIVYGHPDRMILRGTLGTVHYHVHGKLWAVQYDDSGFVIVTDEQHLESAEPTELLRQQLAARDAALDAVLALANDWQTIPSTYPISRPGKQLLELLERHGVRK